MNKPRSNKPVPTVTLLQQSQVDFEFNKQVGHHRLVAEIQNLPQEAEPDVTSMTAPRFNYRLVFGSGLVAVVMFSGMFAYADSAKPGDRLYAVDRFGETMSLAIPRSEAGRIDLQAKIITERLEELSELPNLTQVQASARLRVMHTSQTSLTETIDRSSSWRESLLSTGREDQVEAFNEFLLELETLAKHQEEQALEIKNSLTNDEESLEFESDIQAINKAWRKARQARGFVEGEVKIEVGTDQSKKQTDDGLIKDLRLLEED